MYLPRRQTSLIALHSALKGDIPVVVVRRVPYVSQVLIRVSRAPVLVHHLDVQTVFSTDIETVFGLSNAVPGVRVEGRDQGGRLIRVFPNVHGFVQDLKHSDGPEIFIGVNHFSHPNKEFVGAFIL